MVKLNLGCGKRDFGSDWVHIDGGDFPHLHSHNIEKLDYRDKSVDLIYASHVIEYFDRREILSVLKEWKRVLKIDGVLRIAVPDFYQIAKLYLVDSYDLKKFLGPLYGKISMEIVHMNDNRFKESKIVYHKTVYDFDNLKELLEEVGFRNVNKYDWRETEHSEFDDHSQAYIPHMDKENGTLISLNVECLK
jgi:predicted SAM-dependent methyltransferase